MSRLDTSKPMGKLFGQSPARFMQGGNYFDAMGNQVAVEDVSLSPEEYQKKHPTTTPKAGIQAHKPAEDRPMGHQDVIGNLDDEGDGGHAAAAGLRAPAAPEMSDADHRAELASMNAAQVKKLVVAAGLEPVTGKGSMAKNIELLLAMDNSVNDE